MSVITGFKRCGIPSYTLNSNILGSTNNILRSDGSDLYNKLTSIVCIVTDLPDPVVPATNK